MLILIYLTAKLTLNVCNFFGNYFFMSNYKKIFQVLPLKKRNVEYSTKQGNKRLRPDVTFSNIANFWHDLWKHDREKSAFSKDISNAHAAYDWVS